MVGRLTMDCTKIEQMLPAYTLGSLAKSETVDFTAHIDACASCAVKVREAGDTLVNLARMVPQKRPPERVKELLFASIDHANQPEEEPSRSWMGLGAVPCPPTDPVSRHVACGRFLGRRGGCRLLVEPEFARPPRAEERHRPPDGERRAAGARVAGGPRAAAQAV